MARICHGCIRLNKRHFHNNHSLLPAISISISVPPFPYFFFVSFFILTTGYTKRRPLNEHHVGLKLLNADV